MRLSCKVVRMCGWPLEPTQPSPWPRTSGLWNQLLFQLPSLWWLLWPPLTRSPGPGHLLSNPGKWCQSGSPGPPDKELEG